jgi:hypothetical protein
MAGKRPRTAVERYIEQLGAIGARDSVGVFSLDRERAREMLRRFQLPTPHHFVLPLIRALVRRGATAIAATVDDAHVAVVAEGAVFDRDDLAGLYDAVFARSDAPVVAARRQLALAIGAAQALDLRALHVQSGSGETAAELRYRPGEPEQLDAEPPPGGGTVFRLSYTLSAAVARLRAPSPLPEAALLAERCRFSDVPITLDGRRISHGFALPDADGTVRLDLGEGLCALAGLQRGDRRAAAANLVMDGVHIATHALPGPRGLECIMEASDLQTDLTQVEVVRDAAHDRRLAAVSGHPDLRLLERALALDITALGTPGAVEPELRALRAGLGDPGAHRQAPARTLPCLLADTPLFRVAESPLATPAPLNAIAGPCTSGPPLAVGDQGTLLQLGARGWKPLATPGPEALSAVWSADRHHAFAVGARGTVLHMDHGIVSRQPTPTRCRLTTVWGSGVHDVWTAEWDGPLLHHDGREWTHTSAPTTCCGEALWGSSAHDVLLVGDHGALLQYDGSRWRPRPSGTRERLRAVWGPGPELALVVGDHGTVLRRVGDEFEPVPSGTTANLRAIWGLSARAAWIAGDGGVLLRYDGEQCRPVGRRWGFDFRGIWGANPDLLWAVGGPELRISYWNGLVWSGSHVSLRDLLDALDGRDAIEYVTRPLSPGAGALVRLRRPLCLHVADDELLVLRRVLGPRLQDVTEELTGR